MQKSYYTNLSESELNLCLVGKKVRYMYKGEISKDILVSVHGETLYFRKDGFNTDVFAAEGARVFHNEHDFKTINKIE